MKKEIIICIVVIMIILGLNILSEKYTNDIMDNVTIHLGMVREAILTEDEEKMKENIKNVLEEWDKNKSRLSVYIEHDELEKVELYMVEVNTDIGTKEYNMALESLESCNFIIEHIKDKYKLSLKNIF